MQQWRQNEFASGGEEVHVCTGKYFFIVTLHFFQSIVQLVVFVSAFAMVSTVWSVSCLLFYSRCPHAQPFVKVRGIRASYPMELAQLHTEQKKVHFIEEAISASRQQYLSVKTELASC